MKKIAFYLAASLLFMNLCAAQDAAKATIAITKITANSALTKKLVQDGRKDTLDRVSEALAANLAAAIQATRKFEVVTRADLDAVIKEQSLADSGNVDTTDANAAQIGKLKGAKYILTVSISDFQDYIEKATFESLGKTAEKRILRIGAVAQVIDSSTGALKESASIVLTNADISDKSMSISSNGNLNDALIAELSREMANRIAVRVADVIFPIKVIAVNGNTVTINRGEGAGVNYGEDFEVFAHLGSLKDPDTGEYLGENEIAIGKIRIQRVMPKFSQGETTENRGIDVGHVVRPVPPVPAQ